MRILPIASGKGGVGRSLIAANLSIAMAHAGKRVVLAELDLGGSNLNVMLGLRGLDRGPGTYLADSRRDFEGHQVYRERRELFRPLLVYNLLVDPPDAEKADKPRRSCREYLDVESMDESYRIAGMEAETDFRSKMDHLEELLHRGALTSGDLTETIKTRAFEIGKLKGESRLLKSRLLKAVSAGCGI